MLRIGDCQRSEWTISKGLEKVEIVLEKGNLMCLPSWQAWQLTTIIVLLRGIKWLEIKLLKTWALGWPRRWCHNVLLERRATKVWRDGGAG